MAFKQMFLNNIKLDHTLECEMFSRMCSNVLTHSGLAMPYGDRDLDQHWLRLWLDAWWHQAITWTNVELSSGGFCGIHLRVILQEVFMNSIHDMCLKSTLLKLLPDLPGDNEIKC